MVTRVGYLLLAFAMVVLSASSERPRQRVAAEAWVARYNGAANMADWPTSLVVDGSGHIYVTGASQGVDRDYDYVTIKYDRLGRQAWLARYGGTPNGYDEPWALTLDARGNVYVTGMSQGVDGSWDYLTVKYDDQGRQLSAARYSGVPDGDDQAWAIAVDKAGSSYVTGTSQGVSKVRQCVTVKYDGHGRQVWVTRYPDAEGSSCEASGLVMDSLGHLYVAGTTYEPGACDYVVIKYDDGGNQLWVETFDGLGMGCDQAKAIAVDSLDNVYVAGASQGLGASWDSYDYATVKYSGDGKQLWAARYDGPGGGVDRAQAVATDGFGNVYVTGMSQGMGNRDYATVKYDAQGNMLWAMRYDGPGHGHDRPWALALDGWGNVYVTGISQSGGASEQPTYDYATVKYDGQGNQLWAILYDGPCGGDDRAEVVDVDYHGDVYVAGSSWGCGASTDFATSKYAQ